MDIHELLEVYGIPARSVRQGQLEGRSEEPNSSKRVNNLVGCDGSVKQSAKTFAEAVSGENYSLSTEGNAVPLSQAQLPQIEGGNLTITIDEGEYSKGLEQNQFNVIGRLSMRRGESHLSTLELRRKLEGVWRISNFKVLPVGRGYFQVFLKTMADQSWIMSLGTIDLKPGTFRVSQWVRDFNPALQKQTNAQIWVRIFNLPIEYWRPNILFSIARAAGLPLRIDNATLEFDNCMFARILIDADLLKGLPDKVLVKRKELNFFVDLVYEKVPPFCMGCCGIGHTVGMCRRQGSENSVFTTTTGYNKNSQNTNQVGKAGTGNIVQNFEKVSKEGSQDKAANSQVTPTIGEPEALSSKLVHKDETNHESVPVSTSNAFEVLLEQNEDGKLEQNAPEIQYRDMENDTNGIKDTGSSGENRQNNEVFKKKEKQNNLGKMKSVDINKAMLGRTPDKNVTHRSKEEIRGTAGIPVLPKPNLCVVGRTSSIPGLGETQVYTSKKEPMHLDSRNLHNLNIDSNLLACQQAINDTLAQGQEKLNLVLNKLNSTNTMRGKWPLSTTDKGGGSGPVLTLNEMEKIESEKRRDEGDVVDKGGGNDPTLTLNEEKWTEFEKRRTEGDAEIERVMARLEASQQPKGPQTRSGAKTGIKMGKKK